MKKGFIGPLGDDLPSLIAIMLALTLFFSGLTFSMNVFDQKRERARLMKGALDISRVIIKEKILPMQEEKLKTGEANSTADSNNLAFNAGYGEDGVENLEPHPPDALNDNNGCGNNSIYFSYLVVKEGGDLETLRVCVWEAGA